MAAIGTSQLRLLERLCNASGVSGDEAEVRRIVMAEIKPFVDEVRVDALGNVLATKNAATTGPNAKRVRRHVRVMLDAHMDEVGLMIVAGLVLVMTHVDRLGPAAGTPFHRTR
jgi:endoglucanase